MLETYGMRAQLRVHMR